MHCDILLVQQRYASRVQGVGVWHCWLGDRKGIQPVKKWVLICWWWYFDWSFAHLIAPVVTTTSITLSSNKIQNGDILVPANPGPAGKMAVKMQSAGRQNSMHCACKKVEARWTLVSCDARLTSSNIFCDRCFTAAGPQLWNSLPLSLRQYRSLEQFKHLLKTFLFSAWGHGALW